MKTFMGNLTLRVTASLFSSKRYSKQPNSEAFPRSNRQDHLNLREVISNHLTFLYYHAR